VWHTRQNRPGRPMNSFRWHDSRSHGAWSLVPGRAGRPATTASRGWHSVHGTCACREWGNRPRSESTGRGDSLSRPRHPLAASSAAMTAPVPARMAPKIVATGRAELVLAAASFG
jgi:hypothetical protein